MHIPISDICKEKNWNGLSSFFPLQLVEDFVEFPLLLLFDGAAEPVGEGLGDGIPEAPEGRERALSSFGAIEAGIAEWCAGRWR
ncbi:MAG: hypothetical protein D6812_01725 [Deltaproteobacteria bacterium]|nr:MAG: hypothetical protein D6812_01725 [Deltaproteobacteria bacterium]